MCVDGAAARKIEVTVVGEVHDRTPVGMRLIVDVQLDTFEGIGHGGFKRSGVPFFAVDADVIEANRIATRLSNPSAVLESGRAAMQVVRPIVARKLVGGSIEFEAPLGDAVCVAADDKAVESHHLTRPQ